MGSRLPPANAGNLEITGLVFGGRGIARRDDVAFMVDGALPGQRVNALVVKRGRRLFECRLLEVLERSPQEVETGFQDVPGAPWARLPIELQQKFKTEQLFELFHKFAHLDIAPLFGGWTDSPLPFGYRNKMDYSFGPTERSDGSRQSLFSGFGLGSKARGGFVLVESLEKPSPLFDPEFEKNLSQLREFCQSTDLLPYNQTSGHGFFRYLKVRRSFRRDQLLATLLTTSVGRSAFPHEAFLAKLQELCGGRLRGFSWLIDDHPSDAMLDKAEVAFSFGEDAIEEEMNGLQFRISANSFFQTNTLAGEKLYEKVLELAAEQEGADFLDMYCGVGTISQILAKRFPDALVTGVEISEDAVRDAKENSRSNGIGNVDFHCMDARVFTRSWKRRPDRPLTVVVDPPRPGVDPKPLRRLAGLGAERIIYVSCNPATLARDTQSLKEYGYKLKTISAVDQFVHTHHIECVALFEPVPGFVRTDGPGRGVLPA